MNNKGFGFSEVLAFIGLSMFILISLSIYIDKKIGKNIYENSSLNIEEKQNINDESNTIEQYVRLETMLKDAARKYDFNKSENAVITLNQLKKAKLIEDIIDPHDSTIKCDGYVIYMTNNKEYKPYIYCEGKYISSSYNSDFLK